MGSGMGGEDKRGGGGADQQRIHPPGYIPFYAAMMRPFLGEHCPHTGHYENLTQKKHNYARPVLQ